MNKFERAPGFSVLIHLIAENREYFLCLEKKTFGHFYHIADSHKKIVVYNVINIHAA